MKKLYLVRHGKSSWDDPDLDDFDRPLNKRGEHDASFMGFRLREMNVRIDQLVSSNATRALMTAELFAERLDYPLEKVIKPSAMYGGDVEELLSVVHKLDNNLNEVMLIGHNPGLTEFAQFLTTERFEKIPTSGVFCVGFDVTSWPQIGQESGSLIFFDYPKRHIK
ncbi:histidine phosphatase family protein [candidate division KSB1 bacterium]|nr:histidine phosphatase family protein [candidate division KSB1 bacterium]